MPTTAAPHFPAARASVARSLKSPMPQLCLLQTVELAAQSPAARTRLELRGQIAPIRRDNQIDACRNVAGFELQTVIAQRQTCRQRHRQAASPGTLVQYRVAVTL